jgi:hypothetical protein
MNYLEHNGNQNTLSTNLKHLGNLNIVTPIDYKLEHDTKTLEHELGAN